MNLVRAMGLSLCLMPLIACEEVTNDSDTRFSALAAQSAGVYEVETETVELEDTYSRQTWSMNFTRPLQSQLVLSPISTYDWRRARGSCEFKESGRVERNAEELRLNYLKLECSNACLKSECDTERARLEKQTQKFYRSRLEKDLNRQDVLILKGFGGMETLQGQGLINARNKLKSVELILRKTTTNN